MDLFDSLKRLLGGTHAQPQQREQWQNRIPVGQALTDQDIARLPQQSQANARIYNTNPRDPRVMHMDPAEFGYAADDSEQPQGLRMGQVAPPRLGAAWTFQPQGRDNPGYIPLQNSGFGGPGYAANLQRTFDPQRKQRY